MLPPKTTRAVVAALLVSAWALASCSSAWAWAWPVDGPILREFSLGDNPYAGGQHRGIDIALGGGAVVRAPASGEITFAGPVPTHGLTVSIATDDGHKASLTHVGALRVRRGDRVAEGQSVADAGPSGDAEHAVPYVHLGIRVGDGDTYVDPLSLLPPRAAPSPPPAPAAAPAPVVATAPSPEPSPAPLAESLATPDAAAQPEPAPPPSAPVAAPEPAAATAATSESTTAVEVSGSVEPANVEVRKGDEATPVEPPTSTSSRKFFALSQRIPLAERDRGL